MTRYVVIGAGAVGVTLAAELQAVGRQVALVAREAQRTQLDAGRLTYVRPDGARVVDVPVVSGPDEITLSASDILVIATKTQDAAGLLALWSRQPVEGVAALAGEVLPVVTVQNGLDAERSALRHFADVVGAVVWVPSVYLDDGEVWSPAAPAPAVVWLGSHPDGPPSAAATRLADDLRRAAFEVQVVDDLSRWKAAKLLTSATFVLDALYPPSPERDRAARLLREETLDVLTAAGWDVADTSTESTARLDRFVVHAIAGRARPGSSTWQSLARRREVETPYLNGEVVLLARQLGRRAPINAALTARVLRAVEEDTRPGALTTDDLTLTLAATVLVDAPTLAVELRGSRRPALLDVRWALGDPDGEKHHLDGHLPGAVYVDLDTELASAPGAGVGRHPLPDVAELQDSARRWGIRAGQPVVVHDDNGGQSAARAWWLLRWAGVSDVRILDGGLAAWRAAGGEIVAGAQPAEPGDVTLRPGQLPVLDADAAAALPARGALLDARAGERYRGEVEPVDRQAGHIPGALSLPTGENLDADGRFLPPARLRARFAAAAAASEVGVYCGSGVTAAHQIAALQIAGVDAVLFPGSWSAWSSEAGRPVAVGADPG